MQAIWHRKRTHRREDHTPHRAPAAAGANTNGNNHTRRRAQETAESTRHTRHNRNDSGRRGTGTHTKRLVPHIRQARKRYHSSGRRVARARADRRGVQDPRKTQGRCIHARTTVAARTIRGAHGAHAKRARGTTKGEQPPAHTRKTLKTSTVEALKLTQENRVNKLHSEKLRALGKDNSQPLGKAFFGTS